MAGAPVRIENHACDCFDSAVTVCDVGLLACDSMVTVWVIGLHACDLPVTI